MSAAIAEALDVSPTAENICFSYVCLAPVLCVCVCVCLCVCVSCMCVLKQFSYHIYLYVSLLSII